MYASNIYKGRVRSMLMTWRMGMGDLFLWVVTSTCNYTFPSKYSWYHVSIYECMQITSHESMNGLANLFWLIVFHKYHEISFYRWRGLFHWFEPWLDQWRCFQYLITRDWWFWNKYIHTVLVTNWYHSLDFMNIHSISMGNIWVRFSHFLPNMHDLSIAFTEQNQYIPPNTQSRKATAT